MTNIDHEVGAPGAWTTLYNIIPVIFIVFCYLVICIEVERFARRKRYKYNPHPVLLHSCISFSHTGPATLAAYKNVPILQEGVETHVGFVCTPGDARLVAAALPTTHSFSIRLRLAATFEIPAFAVAYIVCCQTLGAKHRGGVEPTPLVLQRRN